MQFADAEQDLDSLHSAGSAVTFEEPAPEGAIDVDARTEATSCHSRTRCAWPKESPTATSSRCSSQSAAETSGTWRSDERPLLPFAVYAENCRPARRRALDRSFAQPNGLSLLSIIILVPALLIDLGTWGIGFFASRQQVSSYRGT